LPGRTLLPGLDNVSARAKSAARGLRGRWLGGGGLLRNGGSAGDCNRDNAEQGGRPAQMKAPRLRFP
jgi:hypothetical protein